MTVKPIKKSKAMQRLEHVERELSQRKPSAIFMLNCAVMVSFSLAFIWQSLIDNGHGRFTWGMANQFYALWCALIAIVFAIMAKVN